MAITNALTVDVEDYFQVSAFSSNISRSSWDNCECRVEKNINKILEIFSQHQISATFFTLGWIAERYPSLIRKIVDNGHELASHGYGHQRVSELSQSEFFTDVTTSKRILEDISGTEVLGYRAPSFSINTDNFWAFEILRDAGYKYSSSVYPVKHDHYGIPDFPRFSHQIIDGFLEIPVSTIRLSNKNYPSGGGGFFRLLPYHVSSMMLKRINLKDKEPAIFYFHPWEIDWNQPVIKNISLKSKFRHYFNLRKTEDRISRLVVDFDWGRMDDVFEIKKVKN